ncbi:GPI-anchored wall transfer protein [Corchorus capsularis]|uniref:GPI-anchored wall transfer protein n=1 Tax=Corchorus capsularis TaxID=210143 RepID=A0A1R3I421_COCAP|nr:GPI-anchored wall transfer protein [Corchorus capsularis]
MDSLPRSFNPTKHLKEEFVSNLTGSSMLKISALLTTAPILVLLRHSIGSETLTDADIKETSAKKKDSEIIASKNLKAYLATLFVDFLLIVLPMVLLFTVLAEWIYIGTILLSLLLVFSIAVKRSPRVPRLEGPNSVRTSISSYRVGTMFITCLCILAVDFRIFPRELAKTETYGTSLMDLGVGSFVLVNSIISRQARNVSSSLTWWKAALKSTSPLLILGFARLVSTTSMDYQVHVGEYGVHWNFFFTLAGVSILTSIVNVPPKYAGVLGSVILVGYQSWLTNGLNVYLLSDERGMDIISRNKEGIFSLLGYWGMYLIGVQVGYYLFFENRSPSVSRSNDGTRIRVCLLSIMFWFLTLLLDWHVERISRRMCNLAYVTWVLAQNLQLLAMRMLSDYVTGGKISALEKAFDRNLLASFMLANVLTGLVNLSVDTLFASSISALLILTAYAFTLLFVMGIIDFYGIRLKFW